ncbi:hypothetical protein F0562_012372 [Nyssa sinensis]|uniref:Importin subunit beta-1/Transportin-1-like TPR repeats domain-containing protein n=1 Tax=Nyssa sinensis TaxID=561372 RepID=A0A5J4ZUI4_9ASTE|nr:hypothetical protein F0562_012372 [Nyssa sinensis]
MKSSSGVVIDRLLLASDQDQEVLPYCDRIMTHLLKDLSSSELHRFIKLPIFSCFLDVALAIGEHFEKYLPYVIPMMQEASEICAQMGNSDEEMMEYGNQLRRKLRLGLEHPRWA